MKRSWAIPESVAETSERAGAPFGGIIVRWSQPAIAAAFSRS